MHRKVLYEDDTLQWIFFGRDQSKPDSVIDTNEYIIVSNGEVMMLDPGGTEIFPVCSAPCIPGIVHRPWR